MEEKTMKKGLLIILVILLTTNILAQKISDQNWVGRVSPVGLKLAPGKTIHYDITRKDAIQILNDLNFKKDNIHINYPNLFDQEDYMINSDSTTIYLSWYKDKLSKIVLRQKTDSVNAQNNVREVQQNHATFSNKTKYLDHIFYSSNFKDLCISIPLTIGKRKYLKECYKQTFKNQSKPEK